MLIKLKKMYSWPGEIAEQLRVLAALIKDMGLVPRIHLATPIPGDLVPLLPSVSTACAWNTDMYSGTHVQTKQNAFKKYNEESCAENW